MHMLSDMNMIHFCELVESCYEFLSEIPQITYIVHLCLIDYSRKKGWGIHAQKRLLVYKAFITI
jgi:hypothetical protein